MAIKLNADGSYTDPKTKEVYGPDQIEWYQTGDGESGFEYTPRLKTGAKFKTQLTTYPSPTSGAGASWIADPLTTPAYEMSGAEGGYVAAEPNNLIRSYWAQVLPSLGYTGPLYQTVTTDAGTLDESTTSFLSDEALAAIDQFRRQGYDIVRNPQRTDVGSKGITEYGLRLPSGELAGTWEHVAGAWYEQMAPYLGLVLPAVLGVAGTKLGVTPSVPGGAVTVRDVAKSIGANITGQTGNALLNNVVGGAVIGGAKELIASGGDADAAIRGALGGGALAGVAEIAQPYIEKAANALSNLTSEEVAQLAETADATSAAGDVAGDLGQVDVGGAPSLLDVQRQAYESAIAAGLSQEEAINFALQEGQMLSAPSTSGELSGFSPAANANALAGNAAAATAPSVNAMTGGDVASTQVTPTGRIPTVVTDALPERPLAGTTGAGTTGAVTDASLGAAAGAGAAGVAGAAGAAGAGGLMTEADLAGLDPSLTLGAGTDVLGGTDATGAGVAAGAATGAITAGGAAAAGLTGIPVVDDFLSYLGTPAGAAALGAFGSLASGYLTGQAAKDAAQIQADAAANALKLQREQFEYQKELLDPYRRRGESALNRLAGVMGLDGQPAQPQQLLEMDPGYAFRLGEGMKALERVQAARGNMLSGGAIKAGQRYAQDFASNEYGNAYNRLANIAGLGQTVGGQLGTAAQQFGQTAGETMSQGANALAAGRINRTSGYMGGIGGAVGAYQNYQNQQQQNQLFGKFLDIYGRAIGAGG